MSKYTTPLDIFNAALASLGRKPVTENGYGAAARVFRAVYEGNARAAQARHKFGFNRQYRALQYQGPADREGYQRWTFPHDKLLVHSVFIDGQRSRKHEIMGDNLLLPFLDSVTGFNEIAVTAAICYYAPVDLYSADFAEVMVMRMEAIIYKAILEDHVSARSTKADAEAKLLEVIVRDKFQNPPEQWLVPEKTLAVPYTGIRRRHGSR